MFRHALKLIWNRRRVNRLVVVEIAAAFVITFVLTAITLDLIGNYHRPVGFEYENVLSVTARSREAGDSLLFGLVALQGSYADTLEDVLAALRALPRTEAVAPITQTPYRGLVFYPGDRILLNPTANRTTTEALRAVGVELVAGRWFGPEDEGQTYHAVLVNRTYAERAFGSGAEAVGQRIDRPTEQEPGQVLRAAGGSSAPITSARPTEQEPAQNLREVRIVGVIEEFRPHGEFSPTTPYVIYRHEPADVFLPSFTLLLKTAPGTDAGFGEQIVETIESVAPGWVASVMSWEQLRASSLRSTLLPLQAGAAIAALFIVLVVMGLIGVLWQDVVRRTQEIGLRRALGAGAASVRRQIQLEMLVVGAFGIAIGVVTAIQFPLLELIERIDWASSVPALAISAAAILLLVLLGAQYPSWLASRREPADALRYE